MKRSFTKYPDTCITADSRPNNSGKTGEWEDMSWFYHKPMYKCTRCNQILEIGYYPYCPYCGSKNRA